MKSLLKAFPGRENDLKQALPDPWESLSQRLPVGSFHSGTVVRLTKFGAFVNLAEGIDGLIHISKLGGGRRINHPKEVLEEGQTIDVKIEDIDAEQKRLSLALVSEMTEEESDSAREETDLKDFQAKQNKSTAKTSMSTLGDILKAKLQEKEKK